MRAQFDGDNRLIQAWADDSQAPGDAIEVDGAAIDWSVQPNQYVLVDGVLSYEPTADYLVPQLKAKLAETDWVAAKIADVMATGTEAEIAACRERYAQTLMERADWRTQINQLEQLG